MSQQQAAIQVRRFFSALDDVQIGTLADGHLPQWDAATQRWVNRTADAAGLVTKTGDQTIAGAKTWTGAQSIAPATVGATGLTLDLPATAANTGGVGLYITYGAADNGGNTRAMRVFSRTNPNNQEVFSVTRDGKVACVGSASVAPFGVAADAGLPRLSLNAGTGNGMLLASGMSVLWANDASNANQTKDVGLARGAAGRLDVTNGSTGTGQLRAGSISIPSASALTTSPLIIDSSTSASEPVFRLYRSGNTADALACRSNGRWQLLGGISMNVDGDLLLGDEDAKYGMRRGNAQRFWLQGSTTGRTFELDGRSTTNANTRWRCRSSTTDSMTAAYLAVDFSPDTTHATYKARAAFSVFDNATSGATAGRETWRAESDGSRGYQIQSAHATAPADSMLPNDSISFWQTGQAIQFKAKDASGVIRGFGLRYIDGAISVSTIKGVMEVRTEAGSVYGYMPIYNTYGAA